MPRYYFHLHNDIDVRDDEGMELPDLEAAREWAACNARELIAATAKEKGRVTLQHSIDIENEHGQVLDTVWFRDVMKVEG